MRIDFHVHTKFSPDSVSEPERLIRAAVRKKLDAIAITDHGAFEGVIEARRAAQKIAPSFLVIGGEEVLTDKGELLCLFLKRKVKAKKFEGVCREVHKQGGIIAVPHPFDRYRSHPLDLEKLSKKELGMIDAIEACNSRAPSWRDNEKALRFASKHEIPVIAGSDAHFAFELGTSCTFVHAKNEEEIKRGILNGESAVAGKKSRVRGFVVHPLTIAVNRAKKRRWI